MCSSGCRHARHWTASQGLPCVVASSADQPWDSLAFCWSVPEYSLAGNAPCSPSASSGQLEWYLATSGSLCRVLLMPRAANSTMMSARSYLVSRHAHRPSPPQPRPTPTTSYPRSASPARAPIRSNPFTKTEDYEPSPQNTTPVSSCSVTTPTMPSKRRDTSLGSCALNPTAPSTPVQIPSRPKSRDTLRPQKPYRHHGDRRHNSASHRPRDGHSDAIPPSVAALLAITSIPPPKQARSVRQTKMEKRMTVESIIERAQESEKEFSLSLSRSPLDLLLMSPEDLEAEFDSMSYCDSAMGSVLSTRTVSLESMPSLCNSYATDTLSSLESPCTPIRRRSVKPTRRSLTPVSSPPEDVLSHPLSSPEVAVEQLDFSVFEENKAETPDKKVSRSPFKAAFKSNLTASLRALRQAAKSFSNLNFTSIPPEDFLTRSILTIDPQVPYTDERRPPPLEEEPTAALRRYLNPTTTVRLGKQQVTIASGPALRTFTASIQMQTYKVHRARSGSSSGRSPYPSIGPCSASHTAQQQQQSKPTPSEYPMPGPRQREMRENPDFIRVAVMEMAMRKRGKLDDQRPGRARWALPPRKPNTKPYEVGPDGVPARWVPVSC
ncbi:hypothetical protein QBC40DRAFT_291316 [Triangularia verruculosa]|uniref:Uncharacterized protein n=1 Tax=Triangularia verruculosa TaxID=2587418 RepID=A0AAN6X8Q5_9PEZI|nr:hypothetical protein QBC40DRAFT_291316 [Triangularia verruculosa]